MRWMEMNSYLILVLLREERHDERLHLSHRRLSTGQARAPPAHRHHFTCLLCKNILHGHYNDGERVVEYKRHTSLLLVQLKAQIKGRILLRTTILFPSNCCGGLIQLVILSYLPPAGITRP